MNYRLGGKGGDASFDEAKKVVRDWLEQHPRADEPGFTRLRNLIGSQSALRARDKYTVVCNHLGLKWDGLMKEAWDTWQTVRNRSVHAALRAESNNPVKEHFTAVGRIAGALNALVLRVIGYSGIAQTSVYENKHDKI